MKFIDSNLWIYLYSKQDMQKAKTVDLLTDDNDLIISIQVVNEVCCILKKKFAYTEPDIQQVIKDFREIDYCKITMKTIHKASVLRTQYSLSYYDSILIATALKAKCSILYSEDLHDGLVVEGMTIINPFLHPEMFGLQ